MLYQLAKKLLTDLNHGAVIIDAAGHIIEANPEFKRCLFEPAPKGRQACRTFLDLLPALSNSAAPPANKPVIRYRGNAFRLDVYFIDNSSDQTGLRLIMATPVTPPEDQPPSGYNEPMEKLSPKFATLIGKDPEFLHALQLAQRAAHTDLPVLILGESGTGKEILARTIHQAGRRRKKAFVDVNCAAIPDSLVESELFGYEKGAFTGASPAGKTGLFENAHQGSIFMDEIGDAAPQTQAKLLRVLESGQYKRIGGRRNIKVDVRLIAATNQELSHRIAEGRFRADLLYRINTITIQLSPLRERRSDLPLLVNHFLEKAALGRKRKLKFSKEAMTALQNYSWPGNVRELKGVVDYAVTMTPGTVISPRALPSFLSPHITTPQVPSSFATPNPPPRARIEPDTDLLLPVIEKAEREHIGSVLAKSRTRSEAIHRLGISRRTFYSKIKQYGLE